MGRIFATPVASVYPLYVAKVERKGRTRKELDEVIAWLTGFDESALKRHLAKQTTFEDFFADAQLNPNAALITGVVCGVRVEDVEDPLMQKIRYLARRRARAGHDHEEGPPRHSTIAHVAANREGVAGPLHHSG